MNNRFNRPFGPEQVEALISKLRDAAITRQESDRAAADIMFKSLHVLTTLWHECALHDNLTTTAEHVLAATETALSECLEKQSVAHAAAALAEVARLKSLIKDPPERHVPWPDEPEATP